MSRYGWLPDLPDHRDYLFRTYLAAPRAIPAVLPPRVDLSPSCSPVEDQGNLGSCTANALAGATEFLEVKDQVPFADLSRLFIYYNERALEGTTKWDAGAEIRDGIKTLAGDGVCRESLWPYTIKKFRCRPKRVCYVDGKEHQILSYWRIQTLDEMRACLAEGFPFVFGFTVYESFETQTVAQTGVVNMPEPGERTVGGHAVLAVGYDDASKRFIVRNSWGPAWGLRGYFSMPYAYLADRNLSDDLWTVRRGELM